MIETYHKMIRVGLETMLEQAFLQFKKEPTELNRRGLINASTAHLRAVYMVPYQLVNLLTNVGVSSWQGVLNGESQEPESDTDEN
jgi:hypothetical protein